MIYLIGGAPRTGKSVLGQQVSVMLKSSWLSTDVLQELLRVRHAEGSKAEWNADPAAITAKAETFFPYLERFIWGVSSLADSYVIDGVDFLPAQVAQLAVHYPLRALFLGCGQMTLEHFDRFPGRSHGYASLPETTRRQIVHDVPRWSAFIQQEAGRFGYPYIDMSNNFAARLQEAAALLILKPPPHQPHPWPTN
jgi:2-phosphoglycerate kinase